MEAFRLQEQRFTRIRDLLERGVYHIAAPLRMKAYISPEPRSFAAREEGPAKDLLPGDHWGDLFDCAWVHFTGQIPEQFPGEASGVSRKSWCGLIDLSAEGLIVSGKGEPLQGLTSATSRNEFPLGLWGKRNVDLAPLAGPDGSLDFWADFTCCDVEGQYRNQGRVKEAALAWTDELCRDAFYDWQVCQSLFVGLMEKGDPYGEEVALVLEKASALAEDFFGLPASAEGKTISGEELFRLRDAYFTDSPLEASGEKPSFLADPETEPTLKSQLIWPAGLLEEIRGLLASVLSRPAEGSELTYSAIGHSHLDLLFLWTRRETIRKCARTLANVFRMMELDQSAKFTLSQAPVYKWMKEEYPSLYDKMLQRIREGRLEPVGALYIECDTNLPGGESLVRQLLYGKRFFREELGHDMKVCFLPDVFGYSAALPQLLKLADVPYFMTNKLSMNDTNRFPRYTFRWAGLDGSRVLTHMPPENSYQSAAVPQMPIYGEVHDTDKDLCPRGLMLYGLGDGGGGPGLEHIERRKRIRDLKGCPPFEDETVADFFARIEKGSEKYREWHGELYFERHQGTFTSIARQKMWNLTLEKDLHLLEYVSALADAAGVLSYPSAFLKEAWEDVMLFQFHDCLPGSAIVKVYEETQARYAELHAEAEKRIRLALSALLPPDAAEDAVLAVNPAPFASRLSGTGGEMLPPYGLRLFPCAPAEGPARPLKEPLLENERLRLVFTERGTISSLYDKSAGRELLPEGAEGNRLMLYPDELTHWDINKAYLKEKGEPARLISMSGEETDTAKRLQLRFAVGASSTLTQTAELKKGESTVSFETEVDWQEEYQMLRVQFPADILCDEARCGIQFGHVKRPTHTNTSWDEAKFEVCFHKWFDFSDASGGLALLADGKYGCRVQDGALDLCLLRSQNCPAEQGDRGKHRFTYAVCSHTGGVWDGGVIAEAYRLCEPPRIYSVRELRAASAKCAGKDETALSSAKRTGAADIPASGRSSLLPELFSGKGLLSYSESSVVLETVKKAEDRDEWILRFYEASGAPARLFLPQDLPFEVLGLCNLLEEPLEGSALKEAGDGLSLLFRPFEIHSLRVRPRF